MSTGKQIHLVLFRFKKLDKLQAITLTREVHNSTFTKSDNDHFYIGNVELADEVIEEIMTFFVRQHISLTDVDIALYISVSNAGTEWQSPPIVNQMLKQLECPITVIFN